MIVSNLQEFEGASISVQTAAASLERDGAVIVRGMLERDDVQVLKDALIQALEEDKVRGEDYLFKGMVHALMNRGEPFLKMLENPILVPLLRQILGHGCIVNAYNSSSMPPKRTNYSRTIHVDSPRLIPGYITNVGVTVPLDPFTDENGAMEIAPSLREMKDPPAEKDFDREKIILNDLRPGDAIVFNARCWHRGGVNHTDRWRHAVTVNFCRAFMRQQFDYPRMFGLEKQKSFSPSLQQLLGYWVRMPAGMDEFLLPGESRTYRAGQE